MATKPVKAWTCSGIETTSFGMWVSDFGTVVDPAAIFHAVTGNEAIHGIWIEFDNGRTFWHPATPHVYPTGGDIAWGPLDEDDIYPADMEIEWPVIPKPEKKRTWKRPWLRDKEEETDPNVAICNCGTVTTGERWCDDCIGNE